MDIQTAFSTLEKFELEVSQLYERFASTYSDDPEASIVFYRMHLEEKAHASLIRFQKRLAEQNPDLFGDVDLDLNVIMDMSTLVRAILGASAAPDLRTAVRASFLIESSAAEAHCGSAMVEACEEMSHLLSGLSQGDRQHVAALEEFGRRRGYLMAIDVSRPSHLALHISPQNGGRARGEKPPPPGKRSSASF